MRRASFLSVVLCSSFFALGGCAMRAEPIPVEPPIETCDRCQKPPIDPPVEQPVDAPPVLGPGFVEVPVPAGAIYMINAVWSSSATNAWIGGTGFSSNPVLLHWNGSAWASVAVEGASRSHNIGRIWGGAADDIWATSYAGEVFHWDGSHFAGFDIGAVTSMQSASSVAGSSSKDVWISGMGARASTYHFDGATWEERNTADASGIAKLTVSPAGDAWAVTSSHRLHRWNGAAWIELPTSLPMGEVFDAPVATSASSIWLGSWNSADAPAPRAGSAYLFHHDGATFASASGYPSTGPARTWAAAANDVWFVMALTAVGPAEIVRWNGATFERMASPHKDAVEIGGSSSTDVWLAGSDKVYHWGG